MFKSKSDPKLKYFGQRQIAMYTTTPYVDSPSLPQYDLTCPKCSKQGYAATNDGGSIGGCIPCGIRFRSKVQK